MYRYRHGDRPLEGYTIQRGVGRGGFGEVYYALSDAGREVALKMILQNEEIELRGVKHCLNLKSPHLVMIFDVRTGEDGMPWVIMEYVTGLSLRDLLREHPGGLGPQKSAYLMREIAKGLSYLHDRGIVHRDLKPENIFYEDGYVKIGDYGLSKIITGSRQSGQTISVGTVHYMAPEIGTGNYQKTVDIYALGVILHELLTGDVPFKGDSFGEILMKHLTAPPDLSRLEEPFRSAVDSALRKDPRDRVQSVEELVRGVVEDSSVNLSLSRFNPATLSQAAAGFWRRAPGEREAPGGGLVTPDRFSPTSPLHSPGPAAPPSRAARPAAAPAARRPPGAEGDPDNVAQAFRVAAKEIRRRARDRISQLRSRFRLASDRTEGAAAPRPASASLAEVAPGRSARFFWVFAGSALLATGLSCFAAPFIIDFGGSDDAIAPLSFGIASLSYAVFSFYRGTRARHPSSWRRSLRPFLLASGVAGAGIAITGLFVARAMFSYPPLHSDEAAAWAVLLGISVAIVALVFLLEPFFSRWSAIQAATPREAPWPTRPVPTFVRAWDLLLGTSFTISAIATFTFGGLDPWNNDWDHFAFFGISVALGALGFYFYRQAFRRCRGTIWGGSVRPFLLTAVVATILICFLPVALGMHLRDEDVMVLVIAGSIALGLLVPLTVLRGPSVVP